MLRSPGAWHEGLWSLAPAQDGPEPSFLDQVREGRGFRGPAWGCLQGQRARVCVCVCVRVCVCVLCRESSLSIPHSPPPLEPHCSVHSGSAPSALAGDVGHKRGQGCGTCPSWADLLCAHGARDLPAPDLDA